MNTKNLLAVIAVMLGIIALGCTKANSMEIGKNESSEFEKMCTDAGYEWMLMKPTQDGKIIKEEDSCWGCMVEGVEHVCSMAEFEEMTKSMGKTENSSMGHMAMKAHAGNNDYVEIHTYNVSFVKPVIQPGKELFLKFAVKDLDAQPIEHFDIAHDKTMHAVLVRNDLMHFGHIHPEMKEQGVFTVPYNFSASGLYRIWIDFTIDGMQHIVDFDISVPGNSQAIEKNVLGDLNLSFFAPNEIIAGNQTELKFEIHDKNGNPFPITEKFLGADAHLISIDKSLEEFQHNHDEKLDKDNKLSFIYVFSNPGKHKVWIQFQAKGSTKTAVFDINVK